MKVQNNNVSLAFGCSGCSLGKTAVKLLENAGVDSKIAVKHLDEFAPSNGGWMAGEDGQTLNISHDRLAKMAYNHIKGVLDMLKK